MTTVVTHEIKINRALRRSSIGRHPASARAMLAAVPAGAIAKLSSTDLADLLDAMWDLAGASKAIACKDAIDEGGVWDPRRGAFRALAA